MNTVISGFGQGCRIVSNGSIIKFVYNKKEHIFWKKKMNNDPVKNPVVSYEILNSAESASKSSKVKRGIIGSIIGGTAGAIIGASTAKQNKSYTILVHWKNGKNSLIEIDDNYYKIFMDNMIR